MAVLEGANYFLLPLSALLGSALAGGVAGVAGAAGLAGSALAGAGGFAG